MEVHQALPLMTFQSNLKFEQNMECCSLKYTYPITTKFSNKNCDMCKILLWLVEYILNESTLNFKLDRNMVSGTGASEWVSD